MNRKELEDHLKSKIPELYSFAYCFIPDDLQVSQIVIDIFEFFTINKKDLIRQVLQSEQEKLTGSSLLRDVDLTLYQFVYQVAKKRLQHFSSPHEMALVFDVAELSIKESALRFFQLTVEERAILYLWDCWQQDIKSLEYVLSLSSSEIQHKYHVGCSKLKELEKEMANDQNQRRMHGYSPASKGRLPL